MEKQPQKPHPSISTESEKKHDSLENFIQTRNRLLGYLEMLTSQAEDLEHELNTTASKMSPERLHKKTCDWMRIAGQAKELSEKLHAQPKKFD
ncbi:hypothetical protein COU15_00570 [Candidatus Kaiserbacteria bacterium CG10_big_fil_rev_8_21_14_0_10_45_20]|uniref:Uncharacterized protein n=1 Tax=Candidatus Kaiserbacteria bacterium CG10_big_fil_rev_8_21_14_0_10_45_20 TaxID=1974607 RepID=A0A2H0UID8_9BACT|nr:MAG: hypothetical protein COU15_00570 [Candidatus Kaiserbacteria bacterium CG10_big_fil_rev_8_21_14_0_10_45_20]